MGIVVDFARHQRASAGLKPNTEGAARLPTDAKASEKIKKLSCEIRPRSFQLETAVAPTPASAAAADGPPNASMTSSTVLSMPLHSSRTVKLSSLHASAVDTTAIVMAEMAMSESAKALADRLKVTRDALGVTAAQLCKDLDISQNRWSQYESGERRITLPIAIALCERYGVSLDWIYRGDPQRLPYELAMKIRHAA